MSLSPQPIVLTQVDSLPTGSRRPRPLVVVGEAPGGGGGGGEPVTIENILSLTRYETSPGVYPARGTDRTDLCITFVGTVAPPVAAAGSGTNFVTTGTAMDGVDALDLVEA